jgi:hypothetical protein
MMLTDDERKDVAHALRVAAVTYEEQAAGIVRDLPNSADTYAWQASNMRRLAALFEEYKVIRFEVQK